VETGYRDRIGECVLLCSLENWTEEGELECGWPHTRNITRQRYRGVVQSSTCHSATTKSKAKSLDNQFEITYSSTVCCISHYNGPGNSNGTTRFCRCRCWSKL